MLESVGLTEKADVSDTELSGGQAQRLSIACALVHDPELLILDEPTTGLDAGSESLVLEALRRLMRGKTTIVIAHSLATVQQADQIFVVDHGRICERGTHQQLLASGGMYTRLHEFQFGRVAGAPSVA